MRTIKEQGKKLLKEVQDALLAYNVFAHWRGMPQLWCAAAFNDAEKFWKAFKPEMMVWNPWDKNRIFTVRTKDQLISLGLVTTFWQLAFPSCVMEECQWKIKDELDAWVIIDSTNKKQAKSIAKKLADTWDKALKRVSEIAIKNKLIKEKSLSPKKKK